MNQILATENNNKNGKKNLDIKKIIIIFAVIILIFAIAIISVKVYEKVKENKKDKQIDILNKPSIKIEGGEGFCTLTVEYDEGLQKVIYYWNDGDIIEKNMGGSTDPFVTQLAIPDGDYNTLYVKVTGIDGSENEKEQKFMAEDAQQEGKPEISWYYNKETQKIEIIAESAKGIKNIAYEWEDEEQVVVENTGEQEKMTIEIDVKRGTNKINITATDDEGETQIKNEIIQGIFAPEFIVQLVNNKTIVAKVTHDMGFKKVVIKINETEVMYDESHPQYSKEITDIDTSLDVPPGTVTVKISVYTLEEEEKEYTYEASTEILE